jgi:hypothetical protein
MPVQLIFFLTVREKRVHARTLTTEYVEEKAERLEARALRRD